MSPDNAPAANRSCPLAPKTLNTRTTPHHAATQTMKLTDKDKHDRPREKLRAKGAAALTDLELLAAIIGSGNKEHDVVSIAADLQKLLKETLTQNTRLDYPALSAVPGMGEAKICELLAAFELAHRYPPPVSEAPILDTTEKIIAQFAAIRAKKQEHFACLTLDGASRLINNRIIA
ncbi:MAG: hypothetical protein LBT53_05685, partial [Puniceicoccales bacterium]|nr:hypothetical protein [Puniceicoccales bacterium]